MHRAVAKSSKAHRRLFGLGSTVLRPCRLPGHAETVRNVLPRHSVIACNVHYSLFERAERRMERPDADESVRDPWIRDLVGFRQVFPAGSYCKQHEK